MRRIILLFAAAAIAAAASACGSSSSSSPSLGPNDVAIVNGTLITKAQLDHRIQIELAGAKLQGKTVPKVGTAAYDTQVIRGTAAQLVFEAEVRDIGHRLGLSVSESEVQKSLAGIIKSAFGGSQAKFDAYVKTAKLDSADVSDEVSYSLLEHKIQTKLVSQVKVSATDVKTYYAQNRSQYTVAIDASTLHGSAPFSASLAPGALEVNFQKAVKTLPTNRLSQPVPVSKSYMQSQLAGKCKPQCYFLIEPTGPAVKKSGATTRPVEYMLLADLATAQKYRLELVSGQPWKTVAAAVQPLSAVSTQIRTTLLSQRQQSFFTARWAALRKAEDKLVTYAPAYKPAPLPSTTSSSTATS